MRDIQYHLRLHAFDDCGEKELPETHVCCIAADDIDRLEKENAELKTALLATGEATATYLKMAINRGETIDKLCDALHDAIRSPKGVVPKSAEPFYNPTLVQPLSDSLANGVSTW